MEEQTRQTRHHKKKKFRTGRFIFTVLLILIISLLGYSYWQFKEGQELATDTKIPVENFDPDEKHRTIENYLILGVDTRGEEKSRSDTMMMLSWNRETNDMKLVTTRPLRRASVSFIVRRTRRQMLTPCYEPTRAHPHGRSAGSSPSCTKSKKRKGTPYGIPFLLSGCGRRT